MPHVTLEKELGPTKREGRKGLSALNPARDAAATCAFLDASSVPAPGSCERRVYRQFGQLACFFGTHSRFWLSKQLA